jgi:hypothetical protein
MLYEGDTRMKKEESYYLFSSIDPIQFHFFVSETRQDAREVAAVSGHLLGVGG